MIEAFSRKPYETTEGFGTLIPVTGDWYAYARDYLAALERTMEFVGTDEGIAHLWRQVRHINATCTWAVRAEQWAKWLPS
jgi:hypothetical protein